MLLRPDVRNGLLTAGAAMAVLMLGGAGWAGAQALRPVPAASDGRVMLVRYEVRRAPAYVPPPPSEAARLDTLRTDAATTIDPGVLSAESATAWRTLQAEDARRMTAALARVRAEDARVDREMRDTLAGVRETPSETPVAEAQLD